MKNEILSFIENIAQERGIEILYACESGSRAWGFPSPDSDYDIRFIYRHPRDWYISVNEQKDSISVMPNELLDGSGWDVRKVLRLMYKSNVSPYEWLNSPIVYMENKAFTTALRKLSLQYFQPKKAMHHYLGIATGMLDREFKTDEVKIKKYFYVLRPVLAAIYVEKNRKPAPMEFKNLLPNINDENILTEIYNLLEKKEYAAESEKVKRVKLLDDFVSSEMEKCEQLLKSIETKNNNWESINEFYRKLISV